MAPGLWSKKRQSLAAVPAASQVDNGCGSPPLHAGSARQGGSPRVACPSTVAVRFLIAMSCSCDATRRYAGMARVENHKCD
jgi:hypothetical protein